MKSFLRELTLTFVLALTLFFLLQATVQNFYIDGTSMEPSFQDEQRLLVSKVAYYLHEPERGDVLVFRPPQNEQKDYIKRLIALPGDTVEVKKETVYVNDSPLEEPYILSPPRYTVEKHKIPESSYFVLGDNRNNSNDSHKGWVVPRQNIVGKAWLSIWPPGKWGLIPAYPIMESLASALIN